jgi:hypothetical protein
LVELFVGQKEIFELIWWRRRDKIAPERLIASTPLAKLDTLLALSRKFIKEATFPAEPFIQVGKGPI